MAEDQEFKHVCRFCSKGFPCGRSLGGHMRSHMINDVSALTDGTKITKKKLPPLTNNDGGANTNSNNPGTEASGYGLREKPKKTWRSEDHAGEDSSAFDKICKECGKVFQSWKALFGHMKCHSVDRERLSNNNSLEEQQDSWTSANNQKLVVDSQSDNETAAPNRRKRSKRRTKYLGTANSSSLSFANNASSSASEIEQEQEEVAMCLMMLSKDVGQWGGLNSVGESSDNNSAFLEPNRANSKVEGKTSTFNGSETMKVKTSSDKNLENGRSELSASNFSRKGSIKNDRISKSQIDDESGIELGASSKEFGLAHAETVLGKCNLGKRKLGDYLDTELKPTTDALDSEAYKSPVKGSKFECATCNKVFHSYQALGGHRASHKKIKGCFASKIDSSETSIDTEVSPEPTADSKLTKKGSPTVNSTTDCDKKPEIIYGAKKSKGHECPICFKVFPSGQALGGHKRSHLVGTSEARNNITNQEPSPAIRDLLDLNLPASAEEESNGLVGFNSWWIASNHKHEALVSMISN
ncbi:hypothetical protein K2173_007052 [Erythroxylum novogranatense]|uniref:C2H2-type domain-containing protein n=1 Tax=Erythroxylum novogranatense TaxID=1862640 RepID=A0AAV8SKJ6_9ROSI|nr:hypothetical protein K2173_007052 [Erythroxylum novogranatense]